MATIVNDRDIQLEAISPRVASVTLSANITVTQDQVAGLGLVLSGTKNLSLSSTTQVIQVLHDGSTNPSTIVLTANIRNLTETPSLTIAPGSGTMSVTPALTAGVFSFTPAQLTSDSVTLRCQIVDAGITYEDDMTILKVYEGSDGLAGLLTNENVTLPADYLGNVTSYTGAGGQFKVYSGITDVTTVCTFAIAPGGNPDSLTGATINASGSTAGAYIFTGGFPTSHDFTSLTLRATFGTTNIDKVFTISKAKAGTNGGGGSNTATVYLFQRTTTSTPPLVPDTTVTYTFASGVATGIDQGWTQSLPSTGGTFRWITQATALGAGATDTIGTTEWATPAILAQDGSSGLNNALVFLYQRATATPATPTATVTYTFASGVATGVSTPWTQTIPAGTNPIYVTVATAVGSGATDTIASGEWASPVVMAQNGAPGGPGSNGTRGSVTLYVALGGSTNTWSDTTAASSVTAYTSTAPIALDVVTEYNNSQSFSVTKFFDGTNWQTVNAVINGNLLVSGTVGASAFVAQAITSDKIDTRNLTIKDSTGTIIFSAGTIVPISVLPQNVQNNLIDCSWWQVGVGVLSKGWANNDNSGGTDSFAVGTNAHGASEVLWHAVSGTGAAGTGGWNAGGTNYLNFDGTKTYRFIVPIWRDTAGVSGSTWWGILTGSVCDLNTTNVSVNPYFVTGSTPPTGRWCLYVGYVYPYGSTGNSNNGSGYYDMTTGALIAAGSNWNWASAGQVASGTRAYQYYAASGSSQWFGKPVVSLVDGSEPSLSGYLAAGAVSARNPVTSSNVSSFIGTAAIQPAHVNPAAGWLNGNVSINANGTLSGAGSGSVSIVGLGYSGALNATANQSDATTNGAISTAGTTATWSGVSGAGKAADNATVGATFGSNIGGQINSGNVSTYIAAAAISYAQIAYVNANQVSAASLSAITATIGTLRTAASGQRVEISDNLITVYDSSNTIRVKIGNLA